MTIAKHQSEPLLFLDMSTMIFYHRRPCREIKVTKAPRPVITVEYAISNIDITGETIDIFEWFEGKGSASKAKKYLADYELGGWDNEAAVMIRRREFTDGSLGVDDVIATRGDRSALLAGGWIE